MTAPINSVDEVLDRVKPSEWVLDANDEPWCLVETHVMVAQKMWMSGRGPKRYVALECIAYPISEAKIEEGFSCDHPRVNECGHCERCGQIVGDAEAWRTRQWGWGLPPGLTEAQTVALMDQVNAAIREQLGGEA